MSTITLPTLYRSETFGARFGQKHQETLAQAMPVAGLNSQASWNSQAPPRRQVPFLTQLIVGNDPDFHNKLGRADIARAREAAYAGMQAMAERSREADGHRPRALANRSA